MRPLNPKRMTQWAGVEAQETPVDLGCLLQAVVLVECVSLYELLLFMPLEPGIER